MPRMPRWPETCPDLLCFISCLFCFIWIYMDLYGFMWIYMDLYGFMMDLYGFILFYMDLWWLYDVTNIMFWLWGSKKKSNLIPLLNISWKKNLIEDWICSFWVRTWGVVNIRGRDSHGFIMVLSQYIARMFGDHQNKPPKWIRWIKQTGIFDEYLRWNPNGNGMNIRVNQHDG